ncbi:MAG: adenosylcobinamide-GDP ribazoletransferase [Nitrospirota bacterium]|nr:adenosylcobinamide-GDP ribazoletransferase [Nitrospirota bacterium]
MNSVFIAIQLLTRFNLKKVVTLDRASIAASMAWFPVAGAVQGAVLVLSHLFFSLFLPAPLVSGLLVAALFLSNGGLHLDGFADTVDSLAGGSTPERRLEIMKDSSVGAIGAAGLVIILLLKFCAIYALLTHAPDQARFAGLFLFPIVGRWGMVPVACSLKYARPEGGLGGAFEKNSIRVFLISTFITGVALSGLLGPWALTTLGVVWLFSVGASDFFERRLGGFTGDVLGFVSELAEVIFLISLVAFEKIYQVGFDALIASGRAVI